MISNLKGVAAEQYIKEVNWGELERKHRIAIEGNRATVAVRRWPLRDKPLFIATAFLGTKAVDINMNSQNGRPTPTIEWDARETLTESTVASQLKIICMIFLGEWDAAKRFVDAE